MIPFVHRCELCGVDFKAKGRWEAYTCGECYVLACPACRMKKGRRLGDDSSEAANPPYDDLLKERNELAMTLVDVNAQLLDQSTTIDRFIDDAALLEQLEERGGSLMKVEIPGRGFVLCEVQTIFKCKGETVREVLRREITEKRRREAS